MSTRGNFPNGPEVKTLYFHYKGSMLDSPVRELRSYMLHGVAKKNKCLQGQEFLFHLLI